MILHSIIKPEIRRSERLKVDIFLPGEVVSDNVLIPTLVHGTRITVANSRTDDLPRCDGLVTSERSLALGMRTADCAALCFGDGERIGIAHVGWRGLCDGIIQKMLAQFDVAALFSSSAELENKHQRGSQALEVYVAPFLPEFEIQPDFCYDRITAAFGGRFVRSEEEKLIFEFKSAVASLLPPSTVFDERTTKDPAFPSFRRNGTKSGSSPSSAFHEHTQH